MTTDRRTWVLRLLASAAIGVVTGLVVLALEHSVDDILKELFEAPVWVPAAVVAGGAIVTAILTRSLSGGETATTEVYVEEFHRDHPALEPKHAPGRLAAAFTTLASSAPLGMEGPAVSTGSVLAGFLHRRRPQLSAETGAALAGLYAAGRGMTGEPIALASGNSVIDWAIEPDHAVAVIIGAFSSCAPSGPPCRSPAGAWEGCSFL